MSSGVSTVACVEAACAAIACAIRGGRAMEDDAGLPERKRFVALELVPTPEALRRGRAGASEVFGALRRCLVGLVAAAEVSLERKEKEDSDNNYNEKEEEEEDALSLPLFLAEELASMNDGDADAFVVCSLREWGYPLHGVYALRGCFAKGRESPLNVNSRPLFRAINWTIAKHGLFALHREALRSSDVPLPPYPVDTLRCVASSDEPKDEPPEGKHHGESSQTAGNWFYRHQLNEAMSCLGFIELMCRSIRVNLAYYAKLRRKLRAVNLGVTPYEGWLMCNPSDLKAHAKTLVRCVTSLEKEVGYWKWAGASARELGANDGISPQHVQMAIHSRIAELGAQFSRSLEASKSSFTAILKAWNDAKAMLAAAGVGGQSAYATFMTSVRSNVYAMSTAVPTSARCVDLCRESCTGASSLLLFASNEVNKRRAGMNLNRSSCRGSREKLSTCEASGNNTDAGEKIKDRALLDPISVVALHECERALQVAERTGVHIHFFRK